MEDREDIAVSAEKADAEAAHWLERQDAGDWTGEDRAAFEAWFQQSFAHRVAYWRMKAVWSRTERLSVLRRAKLPSRAARAGLSFSFVKKATAAGLAVAAVTAAFFWQSSPSAWTYATPLGGHETIRLGDGSQIELNTETKVRVAAGGVERKVWLDHGEAYFQIRHDAGRPFTVVTENLRIIDLGTKFSVRKMGGRVKVALLEGSARLEPEAPGAKLVVLVPGDIAIAAKGAISVTKAPVQTLSAEMSWRRDLLVFDGTTLEAAASEFNRYNREKLIIADRDAARRTIGGTFPKNGIADFAEVARDMLGLKVTKDGGRIVISR